MALSKEEIKAIINLKARSKTPVYDDDIIRYKEIIKQHLLGNTDSMEPSDIERTERNSKNIIHFLSNTDLDEEERDSYFGVNILPFYALNNRSVSTVKNYVCYEVEEDVFSTDGSNFFKNVRIIFYVMCDMKEKNDLDHETGIARHDLLGHFLVDEFCWSNCFGMQMVVIDNKPRVIDDEFITRTIVLQNKTPNSILTNNKISNTTLKR